jgi:hypothetical protein
MKQFKNIAIAALAGCIGFVLLPSLQADDWDKKTLLTLNAPLEVPSCCTPSHTIVLEPGEYVLVLVDSLSDRHIVRIFDKDQKHVMTTILAIPNYRLRATGKTDFEYWEVPAGQPAALRAWFYPGDNFGQEFAYPKQKAVQIAAFVKAPVPAIVAETSAEADLRTTPLVAVDETGNTAELVITQPEPAAVVAVTTGPAPQAATATPVAATPAQTLPQTASIMPLVGLAGLASLALFFMLGFSSRRRRSCKV